MTHIPDSTPNSPSAKRMFVQDVERFLRGKYHMQRAKIAVVGDPLTTSPLEIRNRLDDIVDVEIVLPTSLRAMRPVDLLIFLDPPSFLSDTDATNFVRGLAAIADEIILPASPHLADPYQYSNELAKWIALLIEANFLPVPATSYLLSLNTILYFRHTALSPSQVASAMTLQVYSLQEQVAVQHFTSRQTDNLLAGITRQVQESSLDPTDTHIQIALLEQELRRVSENWDRLRSTPGYSVLTTLQQIRARLAPPKSRREGVLESFLGWMHILSHRGLRGLSDHFRGELRWRSQSLSAYFDNRRHFQNRLIDIEPISSHPLVQPHTATVDIIICVHNALDDVRRCLESILRHTTSPFNLILVDDGSDTSTQTYLQEFVLRNPGSILLRSDAATGYTYAANRGFRQSNADIVILLNSDTVVTTSWLDRLIACAESDKQIGLVGPLSNTASWQSIPTVAIGGDWAENRLPPGVDVVDWAERIAKHSARLYPTMPFLNGFCLLIRRSVIDEIGFFDEDVFGAGYGEENDYCLRARAAGWTLALADDAYVFHAQSRSYSHETRRQLSERAGQLLAAKHDQALIDRGVRYCQEAGILRGIRERASVLMEREHLIASGHQHFAGKRVLILLPIDSPGGGGNVIITEATAMEKMGVHVHIFNLLANRTSFQRSYPSLNFPVHYGQRDEVADLLPRFDAVVATWYESVYWMTQTGSDFSAVRMGYYIQDFEPYFFPEGSEWYHNAIDSYTRIPELKRFTKTEWNRQEVVNQTGVDATVIGPSVDIDRFRPYGAGPEYPTSPIRVTAMVRPHSPRRSPHLTMQLLRRLSHQYGKRVQITIFGVESNDPGFASLPKDFDWQLAGVIDQYRVETLLGQTDIFVDFSTYQAMGLTALEAMACGAAVIVPQKGGAESFARHGENALVVDTSSDEACWRGLRSLVDDEQLRARLQANAIHDACAFYPERAALNILTVLFGDDSGREAL